MIFQPAILIPVYNHGAACVQVVESLKPLCAETGAKIIVVDDGNGEETKSRLQKLFAENVGLVTLVERPKNGGKGAAFKSGMEAARAMGFTHALQIDADGQHDESRASFFIERAKEKPRTLVCGFPEYDGTAPKSRKNGRKFANGWCRLVTQEKGIKDALCGFRAYPVEETCRAMEESAVDARMGFDIEILVRLVWSGMDFEFHPVRVTYPADGISNFRAIRDNARISWVFTRLCACALARRLKRLFGL